MSVPFLQPLLLLLFFASASSIPTVRVKEHDNATLLCNKEGSDIWILPDDQIVTFNQSLNHTLLTAEGKLFFADVSARDDGTYSCTYRGNDSELVLFRVHMEVEPELDVGNAWEKYQTHFVTGFIAAGVVAGLIMFGCFVFKFRYKDTKKAYGDRGSLMPPSDVEGTMADHRF